MNEDKDYGTKGYGCFTMFVSGVAIVLSIISLLKWDDKVCTVSGENITIAVLSALITFVVAWQIWQTIKAKQEFIEAKQDIEKRCETRLKEFEKKMRAERVAYIKKEKNLNLKIEELHKSIDDVTVMRYYLDDALGSIHYNDGRIIEGALDVLENIYLIVTHKELFEKHFANEYSDKLGVATYFIAKNFKRYKSDQIVKDSDKKRLQKRLENIEQRWIKRYEVISKDKRIPKFVLDRIIVLDAIFNRLVDGVKNDGANFNMPLEDMNDLNDMAKD